MESSCNILPVLPQILLPLSLLASLSLPPFRFRGVLCSSIIVSLVYLCLTSPFPSSTPNTQLRYGLSAAWFWYFPTLYKLLFTVPEASFWRVKRDEKGIDVNEQEALKLNGCAKIRWAAVLLANPRGVGWNYEIKGLPKARFGRNEKGAFLVRQLMRFVVDYLLIEAGMLFVNTYSDPDVLETGTWKDVVLISIACVVVIKSSWEWQWTTASLVAVGLGLSTPEDWPDLFGDITRCTTLGYFWGTYWQQVLKHSLLGISSSIIRFLRIKPRTMCSYAVHLFVGFFLSGAFHFLTLYFLLPTPPPHLFLKNMAFFLAQVPAILIGSYIRSIFFFVDMIAETAEGEPHKPTSIWHRGATFIGYAWVAGFLIATGWLCLDAYFKVGMMEWSVPYAVLGRICSGEGNEGICVVEGLDWGFFGSL